MSYTDNMRINFNLVIDNNEKLYNVDNIINKPIVSNGIPIGVITDARLDESGQYYNCIGVIWDRYIHVDFSYNDSLGLEVDTIRLQ